MSTVTTPAPGLDILEVLSRLPHRQPFLLVDRIGVRVPGVSVTAYKNVTINEPFFSGHFPEDPIMPGVMILEAMAQGAGFVFELEHKRALLAGFDKVRFQGIVRPGDQLEITGDLLVAMTRMGKVKAQAKVAGKRVASAEITYMFEDQS